LEGYDKVLAYTFWPVPSLNLSSRKVSIVGPDCASLHHRRTSQIHPTLKRRFVSRLRAFQFINLERYASQKAEKIFVVGVADKVAFDLHASRTKASFLVHPLSDDVEEHLNTRDGQDAIVAN
jgi:hypothetical protein